MTSSDMPGGGRGDGASGEFLLGFDMPLLLPQKISTPRNLARVKGSKRAKKSVPQVEPSGEQVVQSLETGGEPVETDENQKEVILYLPPARRWDRSSLGGGGTIERSQAVLGPLLFHPQGSRIPTLLRSLCAVLVPTRQHGTQGWPTGLPLWTDWCLSTARSVSVNGTTGPSQGRGSPSGPL